VQELLIEQGVEPATRSVHFICADYTDPLDLAESEFDLLISLYAGFVPNPAPNIYESAARCS
jgi:hypothetical protein